MSPGSVEGKIDKKQEVKAVKSQSIASMIQIMNRICHEKLQDRLHVLGQRKGAVLREQLNMKKSIMQAIETNR